MTSITEVKQLTARILTADDDSDTAKTLYLRAVVETTQTELGGAPRLRAGKPAKLTPEEKARQLAALTVVHERFYAAVMEEARNRLPAGPDKAKRLNAKVNWARTTVYTVRQWIRASHNILAVGTAKLTKAQLKVKAPKRPPSAATLRRRLVDRGKALIAAALELIDTDKDVARGELELIMAQLATQFLNLGGKPVRDAADAAQQHRPFKVKSTVFIPTETMVVRQQSSPS